MSEPLKLQFVLRHARSWDHGLQVERFEAGRDVNTFAFHFRRGKDRLEKLTKIW